MSDYDDVMDTRDTRDVSSLANAGGQRNQPQPHGHALVRPTTGLADRIVGAQPVAVRRDEETILRKLKAMAAAAGKDWFYRFPVRTKDGGQDWIEGPSIKLANSVALTVMNIVTEIRELDVGDAWVFYARCTDIEGGSSMERAFRQRKSQTSMKMKDADRQLDITYQIGQSKAIRNVIVNFLSIYCDYAFEEAHNSLVEKIGKSLDSWRERTIEGIKKMPCEVVRVERLIGRASKDWLAPDLARIIAMMQSVADGMATVDEMFPVPQEVSSPSQTPKSPSEAAAATGQDQPGESAPRPGDPGTEETEQGAADDPIEVAYQAGVKARAAGSTRRAIPGEYRDPKRSAEALAWTAGVEGQPKPSRS